MDEKCYRSTISTIPEEQTLLRDTAIPLFFSVEFEKVGFSAPVLKEELLRCAKCKAYLNPYVEVIMPGYKWRCNLCQTVNETADPFATSARQANEAPKDSIRNAEYNRKYFVREDLRSDIYEVEAPDSFSVRTPDPPVLCFIIEVTTEAQRLGLHSSVLSTLSEVLQGARYDPRTRVCFFFFSSEGYVLNNDSSISVITGNAPRIFKDHILFSLHESPDDDSHPHYRSIDFDGIIEYFSGKKSTDSHPLLPLQLAVDSFRSGTVFLFLSSIPSFGTSALNPTGSIFSKSQEYRTKAESLFLKNLCVNLFVMTRSNIELAEVAFLSQHTGGIISHYSNYDGFDPVSVSKLYSDLTEYFEKEVGFGAVCRTRANEGVVLNTMFGNFRQRTNDLCIYSNFNSVHSINFTVMPITVFRSALYLQLAMIRVTKQGKRMLRIFNICVPSSEKRFYEGCDPMAIAHALLLSSFYYESRKRHGGSEFLDKSLKKIWNELKANYGKIPQNLVYLPQLVLAASKSIPLRPEESTPADFRVFYIYLFCNSYSKISDLLLYPTLLDLSVTEFAPLGLSASNILQNSIYILDTGITLFFYVGEEATSKHLLFAEDAHSGPIVFSPPEDNELSRYVSDIIVYLLEGRPYNPRFVLVLEQEKTIYSAIFKSYLYDDRLYGLPSSAEYTASVNAILR